MSSPVRVRWQRRQRPGSWRPLAIMFALLMIASFASGAAANQVDPEATEEVPTEIVEETMVPEETPIDTGTPEMTPELEPALSNLTIFKYECPAGYDETAPGANPMFECSTAQNGVIFTLDHPDPAEIDLQTMTGDSMDGAVYFGGIEPGSYTMVETLPANTDHAFLLGCDATGIPEYVGYAAGSSHQIEIPEGSDLGCSWFNVPMEEVTPTPETGYTDLTIYKYTCPAGYDAEAWGADPATECPETTNGINFTLTDADPATADLQTMTGDSIDGAVMFGGLEPGAYTVIETIPAGTDFVFVLDCTGLMDGVQRPVPLAVGDTLELDITGYEGQITCHWYNVPANPHGQLTVIKYACTTEEFVSEVDCEIYEDGQTFDLLWLDGQDWAYVDTATTDANGTIVWNDLAEGGYWLEEHNAEWCAIASPMLSQGGDRFLVEAGKDTVVKVYNCGHETVWKTPTKYPNTGVGPVDVESSSLPGFAPAAGLLFAGIAVVGQGRKRLVLPVIRKRGRVRQPAPLAIRHRPLDALAQHPRDRWDIVHPFGRGIF